MTNFTPPKAILEKYAQVLVNFALNSGKGIKKGDVIRLNVSESAKPLYIEVRNQILRSGGHVISNYIADDISREFFELATSDQLKFFPANTSKDWLTRSTTPFLSFPKPINTNLKA